LILEAIFAGTYRAQVLAVSAGVESASHDLDLLADFLERLEREEVNSPRLLELRSALDTDGVPPSARIAQLRRLLGMLDARRNQLFLPIASLLLWGTQVSCAIERWRAECGAVLGPWIDAVGEFEALCAFAGFSYEHPDYPFPEIVEEGACFEGVAIGHPLLPGDRCVRNDVHLDRERQVLVVSGSNMSGKSTLLRTVGVNTVLGLAGAPVCAKSLRLSPLAVGASIRLHDSLREGSSRFYAEILRLREVVDLSRGDRPALFLLDEILHGTNSHDRGIGAEAVVRTLIENGAIGLVTTHDLALTRVADELGARADNVHFQDDHEAGEITFDYRMHDGVVTKSNALALMRAVGLEV
jgi:DNA mismatch repair ATPase MutS